MKKIGLLLLITVFSVVVFAQSKSEKQVAVATEQLKKAMVDGDRAALENIAAEKLSYGHSGGKVEDKVSFVENIANGSSDFISADFKEQTITVSGKTAIVRHILSAKTNDRGKAPGEVNLRIILVWQKQVGKWKLLARQAVKFS
ncbi:MAG: nuclear transport factor 2 family protein [Chitinophagaceae bacterium]|nr:nuclear transport factor 2 family protein [Chitinophagaceae bacterium]